MTLPRFALFFLPADGSQLADLGQSWVGRDMCSGRAVEQPVFPDLAPERLEDLTAAPRHYGFHATLKPPFRLKSGILLPALEARCAEFAKEMAPAKAGPLKVGRLGGFLALLPSGDQSELNILASACVEAFDDLRAEPSDEERRRRSKLGLSERQVAYLEKWGYPYVMEEFRFHMTLTETLKDEEVAPLEALAAGHFAPVLETPLTVDRLVLVAQPDRASPFRQLSLFPLNSA